MANFHTRTVLIVMGTLMAISSTAQAGNSKNFSKQLSLITENDRYLLQGNDRYYTNGIMLNYSLIKHSEKPQLLKRVIKFEVGQKLYTPYSRKIYTSRRIDRPITGYLYGKYSQSNFKKYNQLIEWGVSLGTIGKAALGEGMQDIFHKIIHVNSDWYGWIWDYQLNTEPGINLHGQYAIGLLRNVVPFMQVTPVIKGTLGTSFTNINQGILFQIGKINLLHQSSYWNASAEEASSRDGAGMELYFYYYPELTYQFYNATVQGGYFRKDKGPYISDLEDLVLAHQFGTAFAMSRCTVRLEVTIQSKESKSQRFTHDYGGIHLGYRFN